MFVCMKFAGLGGINSSLQVVSYGSSCLLKSSLTREYETVAVC